MRIILCACAFLLLLALPAAAQHPCDSTPTQVIIRTGQPITIQWCHPGASGFSVRVDAAAFLDVTPTGGVPNATGLKLFSATWPSVSKGNHTVSVKAFNTDPFGGREESAAIVHPFAADDPAVAPVVPTLPRVVQP